MLGEKFHEIMGKITGTRVISDAGSIKVEASYQGQGKLLGIEHNEMGTYTSVMQPSGFLLGEGQGLLMTKDGDSIIWKGFGIGKPTGKGLGASYRYSLHYETTSPRFARLNGVVGVGEWEVDEQGNGKGFTSEWK